MSNMEQVPPPISQEQQLPLDFESPRPLENLTDMELTSLYREKVGIDPRPRSFNRAVMLQGITDPTAELDRIRQIDADSDREELARPYTH